GLTLLWAGRTDEAIASFRRAVDLKPDDPVTHLFLGRAYIRQGRRAEALEEIKMSRQLFGEGFLSMPTAVEIAYYYARLGLHDEAARLIAALEDGALGRRDDGM